MNPAKSGVFLFQTMNKENSTGKKLKQVAIQGIRGSFHEIAATNFFRSDQIGFIQCETFEETINQLTRGSADYAVMAIENTVAGSLLSNYSLLRENMVRITGEEYLRIKQNLLALPGTKIEDIREVHSHYMAINQCREYFKMYPGIKLVESADTAMSARQISEGKIKERGAVAGDIAAQMYSLEILASGIETNKRNFTRFLILASDTNVTAIGSEKFCDTEITKASLCFSLPHQRGSLAKVLTIIAESGLNLTKIQSMPIIGQEFRYFFYADVIFSYYTDFKRTIKDISPYLTELFILGEYSQASASIESIHKI